MNATEFVTFAREIARLIESAKYVTQEDRATLGGEIQFRLREFENSHKLSSHQAGRLAGLRVRLYMECLGVPETHARRLVSQVLTPALYGERPRLCLRWSEDYETVQDALSALIAPPCQSTSAAGSHQQEGITVSLNITATSSPAIGGDRPVISLNGEIVWEGAIVLRADLDTESDLSNSDKARKVAQDRINERFAAFIASDAKFA